MCTGLSGEPTVGQANGRLRDPRGTRGRANGREEAPDCPVCTGLSGEPTVGWANGRLRDLRKTRGRANGRERAPDCPVRQATEGKICLPGMLPTAPSCLGLDSRLEGG